MVKRSPGAINAPYEIDNLAAEGIPEKRLYAIVEAPVTRARLAALPDSLEHVQFFQRLSSSDLKILAGWMESRPHIGLRVYSSLGSRPVQSLDFLQQFSFVSKLIIDVPDLKSWEGLVHASPKLRHLELGQTRSRALSLTVLERFPLLEYLGLERQQKDIGVLSKLSRLRELWLRAVTLPDLSPLGSLSRLETLTIQLGGTTDVGLLPGIGKLKRLELAWIRGLADVDSIGEIATLEQLRLASLKSVTQLPSLSGLSRLRSVVLENMQGVDSLQEVAQAPKMRELVVENMPQLEPEHFECLRKHRTLRELRVSLGANQKSSRKDRAVREMIPFAATPWTP